MHPLLLFLLLLGMSMIESTLLEIPPLDSFHPQLVVVTLMLIALYRGPKLALGLGLLVGLVEDVVYGTFIGINTFAMGVIGYFSGVAFRMFLRRYLAVVVLLVVVFTAAYNFVSFGISMLFSQATVNFWAVVVYAIRMMILNGVLTLLLYVPASKYIPPRRERKWLDEEL